VAGLVVCTLPLLLLPQRNAATRVCFIILPSPTLTKRSLVCVLYSPVSVLTRWGNNTMCRNWCMCFSIEKKDSGQWTVHVSTLNKDRGASPCSYRERPNVSVCQASVPFRVTIVTSRSSGIARSHSGELLGPSLGNSASQPGSLTVPVTPRKRRLITAGFRNRVATCNCVPSPICSGTKLALIRFPRDQAT